MKEETLCWFNYWKNYCKYYFFLLTCNCWVNKNYLKVWNTWSVQKINKKIKNNEVVLLIFKYSPLINLLLENREKIIFVDLLDWKKSLINLDLTQNYCIVGNIKEQKIYYDYLKSNNFKISWINVSYGGN